jgi:hypothetical protein
MFVLPGGLRCFGKVELCVQYVSIDCPPLCSGLVAVRLTPKHHRDVVECVTYLVAYIHSDLTFFGVPFFLLEEVYQFSLLCPQSWIQSVSPILRYAGYLLLAFS